MLTGFMTLLLATAILRPDLPISRAFADCTARLMSRLRAQFTLGRTLLAISMALLVYGAVWTLQGDAPAVLAMAMPELAAWFSTFEIATLVDAMVGIGSVWLAVRASGAGSILRGKATARRRRTQRSRTDLMRGANDDDGPARWVIAA